jgi:hypothetical protein
MKRMKDEIPPGPHMVMGGMGCRGLQAQGLSKNYAMSTKIIGSGAIEVAVGDGVKCMD